MHYALTKITCDMIYAIYYVLILLQGCQPWLVPPCKNVSSEVFSGSMLGPHGLCGNEAPKTPKCDLNCYNPKYDGSYLDDIIKGALFGFKQGWQNSFFSFTSIIMRKQTQHSELFNFRGRKGLKSGIQVK